MKRFLILLLCAVLAVSLLACSKDPVETAAPTTQPEQTTAPTQATTPTTQPTIPPTTAPTGPSYPYDADEAGHLVGLWQTELVVDGELLNMPGLKKSFKLTVYVEFDDLGKIYTFVDKTKAEKAFSDFFAQKTVRKQAKEACYTHLEEQGISRSQAEKAVKETYGMTMEEYVDFYIDTARQALDFEGMSTNTYYYAEGSTVYVLSGDGESWEEYTIDVYDGVMTIEEAVSPDGHFFLIDSADDLPKKLTVVMASWG